MLVKLTISLHSTTENALTCKLLNNNRVVEKTIQFITRFTGSPEEVTGKFDFKHCQSYYDVKTTTFKVVETLITNKELLFNEKSPYPVNALKRMLKFVKQGWIIDDNQLLKISKGIALLDLTDPKVVQEQSTGLYQLGLENEDDEFLKEMGIV